MLQSAQSWETEDLNVKKQALFYSFSPTIGPQFCVSGPFGEWLGDAKVNRSEVAEWVFPDQEIRRILATSFQEIDEVVSVCAQISADESVVWSLLKSYDRNVRTRVYEKELEICERLQMYDFDFRVTAIDLVSPAELTASGFQEIFKR